MRSEKYMRKAQRSQTKAPRHFVPRGFHKNFGNYGVVVVETVVGAVIVLELDELEYHQMPSKTTTMTIIHTTTLVVEPLFTDIEYFKLFSNKRTCSPLYNIRTKKIPLASSPNLFDIIFYLC